MGSAGCHQPGLHRAVQEERSRSGTLMAAVRFKKKEIYPPGVECLGAISLTQSSFLGEGAPSLYSENLITDEDFEVLQIEI